MSSILTLRMSGASLDPHGKPFIDKLKLTSNSVDDIGIYNVKMNIGQDTSNNSHGFSQPYRGFVETASYDFVVTVNPCVVSSVERTARVEDI